MKQLEKAIVSTLIYADIFDYPLTIEEIYKLLIFNKKLKKIPNFLIFKYSLKKACKKLGIETENGFFFFKKRRVILNFRKEREKWSRKKLKIAKKVANWLRIIPWIKMVAITGSLAILNSKKEDDIDILIVSAKKRLWLTRFLATILVELIAKRRRPNDKEFKDKICLNMFLDEGHLLIPPTERDLFSAHEVIQIKPLWDKDNIYQKFLRANSWVKIYLPNSLKTKSLPIKETKQSKKSLRLFTFIFTFFEILAKKIQLWYMSKKRTNEVIKEGFIRFHPQDARKWIIEEYNLRFKKFILR